MEQAGLYCPDDYAWRCGDYGFYLARQMFPDEAFFWVVEYDVRFLGGEASEFFDFFRDSSADLLAAYYRRATPDWRWYSFASGRGIIPYQCIFPVVRLSSRAIDMLLDKRVQQGRSRQRQKTWANDESFVATTLTNCGMDCHDFNDFGTTFYGPETFHFHRVIDGNEMDETPDGLMLYHPVLFGEDYSRKIEALKSKPNLKARERLEQRIRRQFNFCMKW